MTARHSRWDRTWVDRSSAPARGGGARPLGGPAPWARYFGSLGSRYDDVAFAGASLHNLAVGETELVRRVLGHGPAGALLDVGAGTGRFTSLAVDAGWRVTAFDAAPEMLAIIADRHPMVTTVEGQLGEVLPFPDSAFDAVVAMRVVKYVADIEGAIAELARVVAPGGSVVFDLANGRSLARFGYPRNSVSFATPAAVPELLERAGLHAVATIPGPRLPHPLYRRFRGPESARALARAERLLASVLDRETAARSLLVHAVRGR
ncbi:MAG: class I SAM-dependent methyltransferase [Actinomycetota bacterium]|nr:class I SAM-dependent methyltransferase [Actinomycetota bacterium]